mmetsp:Transcript_37032/g.124076  ORF Transcript_37032/g.124076 Transcript_37032/m.124076 type:complete len:253 (-) Transcript_37032:25-783(-)
MAQAVRALTCGSTEKPTNDDSAEVSLRCANGPTAPAPASGSPLEAAGAGAALAAPTMLRPRPPRVLRVPPERESAGEVRREARGAWRGVAISPTSACSGKVPKRFRNGSEKVPRRLKEGSCSRRGGGGCPLAGRLEKAAEVAAELEEAGRDGRREVVPRQREAERDQRRQAVGSGGVCHVAEGEHLAPVERHGQDSVPATLQSHVVPRGEDVHDLLCKPGVRLAIERDRVKLARAGGAKRLLEVSAHGRDAM